MCYRIARCVKSRLIPFNNSANTGNYFKYLRNMKEQETNLLQQTFIFNRNSIGTPMVITL